MADSQLFSGLLCKATTHTVRQLAFTFKNLPTIRNAATSYRMTLEDNENEITELLKGVANRQKWQNGLHRRYVDEVLLELEINHQIIQLLNGDIDIDDLCTEYQGLEKIDVINILKDNLKILVKCFNVIKTGVLAVNKDESLPNNRLLRLMFIPVLNEGIYSLNLKFFFKDNFSGSGHSIKNLSIQDNVITFDNLKLILENDQFVVDWFSFTQAYFNIMRLVAYSYFSHMLSHHKWGSNTNVWKLLKDIVPENDIYRNLLRMIIFYVRGTHANDAVEMSRIEKFLILCVSEDYGATYLLVKGFYSSTTLRAMLGDMKRSIFSENGFDVLRNGRIRLLNMNRRWDEIMPIVVNTHRIDKRVFRGPHEPAVCDTDISEIFGN